MSAAAGLDVRRATPADAVPLAEVHTQCWQQTYRGLLSDAFLAALKPADRLAMWRQLLLEASLGTGPASLWVAAGNAKAIGFYERLGFAPDGAEDRVADWEDLHEIRMIRSC
ncbi:hypothetical protein [Pseudarthrobacter sp. Y6]|uniref:hypothetical protein n=1 Tax=Pseudarthrobacter sp. Y6 TaxID=3418422 RepID=UPI003CECD15C